MKKTLFIVALLAIFGMNTNATPIILDEIDDLTTTQQTAKAIEQQHILELCHSKKNQKPCEEINKMMRWANSPEFKNPIFKFPILMDLLKNTKKIGLILDWDDKRIGEEFKLLAAEFNTRSGKK